MKFSKLLLKSIAMLLSVTLFGTNVLFANAPEKNFWSERQKALQETSKNSSQPTQLASLPANFQSNPAQALNQFSFPTPKGLTPSLSKELMKGIQKNSEKKFSKIFQSLPSTLGSIRKVSVADGGHKSKIVIHIQDVHQNIEAQENISASIQSLIGNNQVDMVALEGAFQSIDFSSVQKFPYPDSVKAVADYLLSEKKITGPVYAALTLRLRSGQALPMVEGVDDREHYLANVEAYKKSAHYIKGYKEKVANAEFKLAQQKKETFNPELASFDAVVQSYRSGTLPMGPYVDAVTKNLTDLSAELEVFLQAWKAETTMNFSKVEAERTQIITQLLKKLNKQQTTDLLNASVAYRLGNIRHADFYGYLKSTCEKNGIPLSKFKAMDGYIQYVLLTEAINPEKLFSQLQVMEKQVYASLAKSDQEKSLIEESTNLHLTKKLLDFSLTPEEWREYRRGEVSSPSTTGTVPLGRGDLAPTELASFAAFYEEAEARDQAMTENLLKKMDETKSSVAVLVTGGFHSTGMDQRLHDAGVTTITFAPKITKVEDENGSAYLSIFTQEKTPLDRLFQGEKLFVVQEQMNAPVRVIPFARIASVIINGISDPLVRLIRRGAKATGTLDGSNGQIYAASIEDKKVVRLELNPVRLGNPILSARVFLTKALFG